MLTLQQVKLPVSHTREDLEKKIVKTLNISSQELQSWKIRKRSLDARKKPELYFVYTIDASVKKENKVLKKVNNKNVMLTNRKKFSYLCLPDGITQKDLETCRRACGSFLRLLSGPGRAAAHSSGTWRRCGPENRKSKPFLENRRAGYREQCPVRRGRRRDFLRWKTEYPG